MESIVAAISALLGIVKEVLGLKSKQVDLKNAADVKQAAVNQAELDAVSKTEKAVAEKNLDEARTEISE